MSTLRVNNIISLDGSEFDFQGIGNDLKVRAKGTLTQETLEQWAYRTLFPNDSQVTASGGSTPRTLSEWMDLIETGTSVLTIYPDEGTGRADVSDGDFYFVIGSDSTVSKEIWRRVNSSSSEYISSEPTRAYVEETRKVADANQLFLTRFDDKGVVIDSQDGDATVELRGDSPKALLVATLQEEYLAVDTQKRRIQLSSVFSDTVQAGEGTVYADATDLRSIEFSSKAGTTIADSTGSSVLGIDPLRRELSSSYHAQFQGVSTRGADGNYFDATDVRTFELSATKTTLIADASGNSVMEIDPTTRTINTNFLINQNQEGRPTYIAVEEGPVTFSSDADRAPYAESLRPYQGTPSIVITGSRLWMSWRADLVVGENPGNFLVVAKSDDDGATWEETDIVTYEGDPMYQLVDPMMWVSPEGILYFWYGIFGKNQGQDGVCSFWAQTCKNPTAEFRSWSKPFRMSYFGDPRHATPINEEYWIPVDTWRSNAAYPPAYPSKSGPRICRLDYKDRIARPISRLPPNHNGGYSGFFETEIVQLSTGRIMATNRRPTVGLLRCFSDDDGQTWSDFEDYTPVLGDVSSSRIWLGTLPSGRLAICYNNDNIRRTLTLAISEDDGESFPYSVVLDQDLNSQRSYPILAFNGDQIYVVYDNERENFARIRLAKVLESEIIAGSSTPEYITVSQP